MLFFSLRDNNRNATTVVTISVPTMISKNVMIIANLRNERAKRIGWNNVISLVIGSHYILSVVRAGK
tara:strand:+ start:386 stop:586 length:201 start_codon:yes stop_codon:yes gene_type:complete